MARTLEAIADELRAEALTYPETYEESPWGDRVVKCKGKMYFLAGVHKDKLYVTAKLPVSGKMALQLPFAQPTGYGLGKYGWVTAHFEKPTQVPVPMMLEWIEESFRAVAPKSVLKAWEAARSGAPVKPAAKTKAGAPARAKAAAPAKTAPAVKGTKITLVGDDQLRMARAREALEARGFKIAAVVAPDGEVLPQLKAAKAVIIDLGRRAPLGLELAASLARTEFKKLPLFFAGARDAAAEKKAAQAVPGAACARVPPGDAEFVELVVERLAGKR